jgi:hypothetical protein
MDINHGSHQLSKTITGAAISTLGNKPALRTGNHTTMTTPRTGNNTTPVASRVTDIATRRK